MRLTLLVSVCMILAQGACLSPLAYAVDAQLPSGHAANAATSTHEVDDSQVIVFEATLDGHELSDSLAAYQDDGRILLPLGELSRLLTLAITVDAAAGRASGFVIREDRSFGLNVAHGLVNTEGQEHRFGHEDVRVIGDDIYVSHVLLRQWLPLDLDIDLPTLQVRIKPRVMLPLQERLRREQMGAANHGVGVATDSMRNYVRQEEPFALIRAPFIDQTFGGDARFGRASRQYKTSYAAYLTADVLGMEGEAYVSRSREQNGFDTRWTLGRSDPMGRLLGPLGVRSLSLGHVVIPGLPHVFSSRSGGLGASISNRPLGQPSDFDRHSIRGDLPPGWDVNLYYNDGLIGFQSSNGDGRYAFEDLPLSMGMNEFRLVFNGPLGQVRVERQTFMLDQAVMKPGELVYGVSGQHLGDGGYAGQAQFDLGLTHAVSANLGLVHLQDPRTGSASFVQGGLRAYWQGAIASWHLTQAASGGWLTDIGLKTRLGQNAVFWDHMSRDRRFQSELYMAGAGGLVRRDRVGIQGSVGLFDRQPLSVSMDAGGDVLASGAHQASLNARVSTLLASAAVTQSLRWQQQEGRQSVDGSLQLSRRVADIGLSGQIDVGVKPQAVVHTVAVTADHELSNGYRLNGGALYSELARSTQMSGGVSKNFGGLAVALTLGASSKGEQTMSLQLFVALGKDPRTRSWFAEAQPLAGTGAVSLQAFVDRNMNGVRDPGEEPVSRAGFIFNHGGRHSGRTDAQGRLLISRLTPGQYADIALDASSLEDPQWHSVRQGVRVLPRPGLVQQLEFPVVYSAEVEGTVYLVDSSGRRRGIGDARLELVDEQGQVQGTTKSSPDGYYLMHQVMPGRATLRVDPEQVSKLGLTGRLSRQLDVPADGDFLVGQDFEVQMLGAK
jgi:hypothetical protein